MFARGFSLFIEPCDDFWRYRWESKVWLAGENPYILSPLHPDLFELRDEAWAKINHPEYSAIYPPLTQLLMVFSGSWSSLGPYPLKVCLICFDLLSLLLLVRWKKKEEHQESHSETLFYATRGPPKEVKSKKSNQAAIIFFLNPLLIHECAGRTHFESLFLLTCLMAAYFWSYTHQWRSSLSLALATLTKTLSLVLYPILFLDSIQERRNIKHALLGLSLSLITSMLLLYLSGSLVTTWNFASDFRYNAFVPNLIDFIGLKKDQSTIFLGILFSCSFSLLLLSMRKNSLSLRIYGSFLLMLAFLPTVHPWYFLWPLPFAALAGFKNAAPLLLLTCICTMNYVVTYRSALGEPWQEISGLWAWQYFPALLLTLVLWRKSFKSFIPLAKLYK